MMYKLLQLASPGDLHYCQWNVVAVANKDIDTLLFAINKNLPKLSRRGYHMEPKSLHELMNFMSQMAYIAHRIDLRNLLGPLNLYILFHVKPVDTFFMK